MFCEPSSSADIAVKALKSLKEAKKKLGEIIDEIKRHSDPAQSLGRLRQTNVNLAMLDVCPDVFSRLEARITIEVSEEMQNIGPQIDAIMGALSKLQTLLHDDASLKQLSSTFEPDLMAVIDFYSNLVNTVTALVDETGTTFNSFFTGEKTKNISDASVLTTLPYEVTVALERLNSDLKRISKKTKDAS